jgi:hypothetical protein
MMQSRVHTGMHQLPAHLSGRKDPIRTQQTRVELWLVELARLIPISTLHALVLPFAVVLT